jgi:hypothetical protein
LPAVYSTIAGHMEFVRYFDHAVNRRDRDVVGRSEVIGDPGVIGSPRNDCAFAGSNQHSPK